MEALPRRLHHSSLTHPDHKYAALVAQALLPALFLPIFSSAALHTLVTIHAAFVAQAFLPALFLPIFRSVVTTPRKSILATRERPSPHRLLRNSSS
jgi:hypothetical protein